MPDLQAILTEASEALVAMDYPRCEKLCVQALEKAREQGDWETYARAIHPLQESRRQRRMSAGDAAVQLGTGEGFDGFDGPGGCVCFTYPHQPRDAWDYWQRSIDARRNVQVMYADCAASTKRWTLRSLREPEIIVDTPAPPEAFLNRVVHPMAADPASGLTPIHWFITVHELLGDTALAAVSALPGTADRVDQLEAMITAVGDHEILHQRLRDAVLAMRRNTPETASA
jgi:hypothetical protein